MHRLFTSLLLIALPGVAVAQTDDSITLVMFLHGMIGFFGALSLVVFVAGFLIYITRLGTERREDGIKVMEKGFTIMMVVILCVAVLYWVR